MLTLALDTTGDFGSIALVEGAQTIEEVLLHAPQGFSHILFAQIEALLERHGKSLAAVELYAAASGPGSFTGVRVGLSAVKAFAEVFQRPVIAISNLVALGSFGTAPLRATVIDAKRGEVYAALFDRYASAVIPEQVVAFSRFLEQLPVTPIEWIASDFATFLPPTFANAALTTAPRALSAAIGRLAIHELQKGGAHLPTPEAIDANYVRRSDAELLWKGL